MKTAMKIWIVAALIATGGLFYVNTSLNAIEIVSDNTEATNAPELTAATGTIIGTYELQGGVDAWNIQPATVTIQN